jgi:glycosyltransferase involved in cell wall biosynthesis
VEASAVAIVVPAWNEAGTIASIVHRSLPYGVVVVVDDCSTDETSREAGGAGAEVVRHGRNQGYDGALSTGFDLAKKMGARWIVTMDADGSHDPGHIPEMVAKLEGGASIVVGTRPTMARFSERLFGLWTGIRWGIPDPLCGMKAYRADLLDRFGSFDRYRSIGTDLLVRTLRAGETVEHRPISCRFRESGESRFGSGWPANRKILRALWKAMTSPTGEVSPHRERDPGVRARIVKEDEPIPRRAK